MAAMRKKNTKGIPLYTTINLLKLTNLLFHRKMFSNVCFNYLIMLTGGRKWADGTAEHFEAEATFDFEGEQDDELSFRRGQRIRVAPKGRLFLS